MSDDNEKRSPIRRYVGDRIAPIASQQSFYSGSRSGFVVRVGQERVPIGSMGDGIWRILGLILAIVNVKDGSY